MSLSEDKQLVYFVSSDFNRASRDQQVYGSCVLYILKDIIFKSDHDPSEHFYSYDDEDYIYIEELTNNGPVDFVINALNPMSAVIQTLFENDEELVK